MVGGWCEVRKCHRVRGSMEGAALPREKSCRSADMLCTKTSSEIVLPYGAFTIENGADRPTVSALKGVGFNLAALAHEALHLLQDEVTTELRV